MRCHAHSADPRGLDACVRQSTRLTCGIGRDGVLSRTCAPSGRQQGCLRSPAGPDTAHVVYMTNTRSHFLPKDIVRIVATDEIVELDNIDDAGNARAYGPSGWVTVTLDEIEHVKPERVTFLDVVFDLFQSPLV